MSNWSHSNKYDIYQHVAGQAGYDDRIARLYAEMRQAQARADQAHRQYLGGIRHGTPDRITSDEYDYLRDVARRAEYAYRQACAERANFTTATGYTNGHARQSRRR